MLYISSGRIDVTPAQKIPLFGYSPNRRHGAYDDIADSLEVNIVIFRHNEEYSVFISADALYVTDEIKSAIIKEINKIVPISEEKLLIGASHTHYAPSLDPSKPLLGEFNKDYQCFFIDKVIFLIKKLLCQKFIPISVFYGRGQARHSVVRRKKVWTMSRFFYLQKKAMWFPDDGAYNDQTINVLVLKNDNRTKCIIWNYSCHPSGLGKCNKVSAAYPGGVRAHIRKENNDPELPILFFQGFCGDINPFVVDNKKTLKSEILRFLNKGKRPFGEFTDSEYKKWSFSLADIVLRIVKNAVNEINISFRYQIIKRPLSDFIDGNNMNKFVSFQKIELNPKLILIALSAEPVMCYTECIKDILNEATVIPIGYINSVYGYLPAKESIYEKTYEGGGFFSSFNINGHFRNNIERVFTEVIRKL